MENNTNHKEEPLTIPYVIHRDMVTHDRWVIKRLVNALIIIVIFFVLFLFVDNMLWLKAWNEYDYVSDETTTTIDSQGYGIANYTGGNGGVMYAPGDGAQSGEIEDEEEWREQGNETPQEIVE